MPSNMPDFPLSNSSKNGMLLPGLLLIVNPHPDQRFALIQEKSKIRSSPQM